MASRLGAALLVTTLLIACGGGDKSTLERADDSFAKLHTAVIDLRFTTSASDASGATTGPVGFRLEGSFDSEAGATFPVLDLTYTRLIGGKEQVLQVQSDGTRLVVTADGKATEVAAGDAGPLRKSEGGDESVVGGLGIAGWVDDATETDGPDVDGTSTRRVTGRADVADLLNDLATLTAQLSGTASAPPLEGASAERVRALLTSSSVEVDVGRDDHVPRHVVARLDFGTATAEQLRDALGPLAGAHLQVELTVRHPGDPVAPPSLPGK